MLNLFGLAEGPACSGARSDEGIPESWDPSNATITYTRPVYVPQEG